MYCPNCGKKLKDLGSALDTGKSIVFLLNTHKKNAPDLIICPHCKTKALVKIHKDLEFLLDLVARIQT